MVFVMDLISNSVASRIERGLLIFVPCPLFNTVCEREKIATCSDRFHARVTRSHIINLRFTFTSRSRRYEIHTIENRLFDFSRSRFTFTFQVHV